MSRVLIVYGTSYGQTAKVVRRLSDRLEAGGHLVTMYKGDELPALQGLAAFDGVVVAGSVLFGRYQRYLLRFVRRHLDALRRLPSAFVSICGAAGHPESRAQAESYISRFEAATGWQPRLSRSFAGAIAYTRYGPITRWMMKRISRRNGRSTDTSRDWELTDWGAVDGFASEFSNLLGSTAGTGAP